MIIFNLKMFGGVRWNYLVVWGYVLKKNNNDEEKVKEFVSEFFKYVFVFDFGVCGFMIIFVECGIGDVLLVWENEVFLLVKELGLDKFDIVVFFVSILVELFVVIVDKNVDKKGSCEVVDVYLKYLYSEEG